MHKSRFLSCFSIRAAAVGAYAMLAAVLIVLPNPARAANPIVLELFTSNSCSSCPPAYAALDRLTGTKDDGAPEFIRLDEHVDYWNALGWVDRYSRPAFTDRQRLYARQVFDGGPVYTPQLVVNGQIGLIGSRDTAIRQAIAAQTGQVMPLAIAVRVHGRHVLAQASLPPGLDAARLWFALTQDNVVSQVGAGENAGRTLHENGVVRGMVPGNAADAAQLTLPDNATPDDLHVVALVQETDQRVVAAGQRDLGR